MSAWNAWKRLDEDLASAQGFAFSLDQEGNRTMELKSWTNLLTILQKRLLQRPACEHRTATLAREWFLSCKSLRDRACSLLADTAVDCPPGYFWTLGDNAVDSRNSRETTFGRFVGQSASMVLVHLFFFSNCFTIVLWEAETSVL